MCDVLDLPQTFWMEIALVFPASYLHTWLKSMKKLLDFAMEKKNPLAALILREYFNFVVFNKIPDKEWLSKA